MEFDGSEVVAADAAFFAGLLAADAAALRGLLADDFLIVDVMSGAVTDGGDFLGAIGSGQLVFTAIRPAPTERVVRGYGTAAVVVGRTEMVGRFAAAGFETRSRYTHVFVRDGGRWLLASAQGTPITGPTEP